MALLKCKMCGGDIELSAEKTFGTCEYCGSTMTFPKVDDDQRAAAFNRGNHFRRIGEFDKALAVYERIVREDDTDAEAHWCCALCRFGIEYVEDPATLEYLPTCHRASFDSFLEDVDYLAAVAHSDGITRRQYKKDGARIAEVQRGILATSQNETPFDVFICYKESDDNGQRTRDSLMAQDVYYQLTDRGYRVFFSRITLEDIGGKQYEPYIFAALNSAKVMIVIGTKPEHMNAVWVKNEWSRFLAMMKKERNKLLLPCYRDMDPYDMPEQLSVLQSYDMSKIGFIQDLVRGIQKVLDAEKALKPAKETVVMQPTVNANIAPLLKRVAIFLEDGDWKSADEYCEKVLDIDPECAEAYLGKLMVVLHARHQKDLVNCREPFDREPYFQKIMRFGNQALTNELKQYNAHIQNRNRITYLEGIYAKAVSTIEHAKSRGDLDAAATLLDSISAYKNSAELAVTCRKKANEMHMDMIYANAKHHMDSSPSQIKNYQIAISEFKRIPGWKDADDLCTTCQKRLEKLKAEEVSRRLEYKRKVRIISFCAIFLAVLFITIAVLGMLEDPQNTIQLRKANIGDYVLFGSYEQDNNQYNGTEQIEWIVLAKREDKILVLSKYALDYQAYSSVLADTTWNNCYLNRWLNNTFYNTAFSEDERKLIPIVTVTADENPDTSTDPGKNTRDHIFLLSVTEYRKYCTSLPLKECEPTDAVVAKMSFEDRQLENCRWWLRTPGHVQHDAAYVDGAGYCFSFGADVDTVCAIRPAMWIDLNAT